MTADCGVSDLLVDHIATMRFCPMGLEAVLTHSRRAVCDALIAETGPGPDGSSLTAYYQRSWGCGTEKCCDIHLQVLATRSVPSTYFICTVVRIAVPNVMQSSYRYDAVIVPDATHSLDFILTIHFFEVPGNPF